MTAVPMNGKATRSTELSLDARYELLREVKGCTEGETVTLGTPGICRYCGMRDPKLFRNVSHTFPEALGNKWVVSQDECDECNTGPFALYDEELAKAVTPFLTLGGVKGKRNKTRQTGRTQGNSIILQRREAGRRRLSVILKDIDPDGLFAVDPSTGRMKFRTPVAPVPFKPRHAYKALSKMAVALLPDDELGNYTKLIDWLRNPNDSEEFPVLEVSLSLASIGNAPPLVYGALLRRKNPTDVVPHIIFVFCAGSVCFQIALMSDHKEDHIPPVLMGTINIHYNITVGDDTGRTDTRLTFRYGAPVHMNWSSAETEPQPIETVVLDFDPSTTEGRFIPIFRKPMSRPQN